MDQRRKIMMQHETFFKEQVQALHKLYSIQKMVMQECKRRNHYGGQYKGLAFTRQSVMLVEDQFPSSILEGRPLMPVFGYGRARKEETLALSLHPFRAFKDFELPRSLGIDGSWVGSILTVESKPMRNFDLEKLPEDFEDESEIQGLPLWLTPFEPVKLEQTILQRTPKQRKESAAIDPVKCSQGSTVPGTLQHESDNLNEFSSPRSICREMNSGSEELSLALQTVTDRNIDLSQRLERQESQQSISGQRCNNNGTYDAPRHKDHSLYRWSEFFLSKGEGKLSECKEVQSLAKML